MTSPQPPYPPASDTWRFPPPPIGRRWRWLALGGTIGSLVIGIGATAVLVAFGTDDFPASFDDTRVSDAVEKACDRLEDVVAGTPVTGDAPRRAAAIRAQNGSVTTLVETIRALGPILDEDEPVRPWLVDWERLVAAREAYAAGLPTDSAATFTEPKIDGRRVSERMDQVARPYCEVPQALLEPDAGITRSV